MAKRKRTTRKVAKKGISNKIPSKHHDRVIVYGGLVAIFLLLLVTQIM